MNNNQDRDLKLLRMVYSIIGLIMLLAMQIVPYDSPKTRLQVSLIVAAVIFGVGFNSARKLKKAVKERDEGLELREKAKLKELKEKIEKENQDLDMN